MNINLAIHFSDELLTTIFSNLSGEDLVRVSRICRRFYQISQDKSLPEHLMIRKLNHRIVQENAILLFDNPESNFEVDKNGALIKIRSYQILKLLKNWIFTETTKEQVSKATEITLQEIYRINREQHIRKGCPVLMYVWHNTTDASYYPAYFLAEKILKSKQFNNQSYVHKAASLVQSQANLYPNIEVIQVVSLYSLIMKGAALYDYDNKIIKGHVGKTHPGVYFNQDSQYKYMKNYRPTFDN